MERRYLVKTDHGDVLVRVDPSKGGLDPELLILAPASGDDVADIRSEVPLRAFGAKMVEIIEMQGGDLPGSERLRRILVQEKASEDLNRIERWARDELAGATARDDEEGAGEGAG
ncbi:MAG: hypothetical protein WD336_08595 [Trueperaceae bacterium]